MEIRHSSPDERFAARNAHRRPKARALSRFSDEGRNRNTFSREAPVIAHAQLANAGPVVAGLQVGQ